MTHKQAERITGLTIRATQPVPHGDCAFIGINSNDVAIVAGRSRSSGDALNKLVDNHYKMVCKEVALKQKHKCWECGKFGPMQFHHVQHRSKGRIDSLDNIVGLCPMCHGRQHGTA